MKICALILAVVVTAAPMTATAAEPGVTKNNCLVYGENCPEQGDAILETIDKLQQEIARGERLYTPAEIARLERKLEEYQGLLDSLLSGGGGD